MPKFQKLPKVVAEAPALKILAILAISAILAIP
jgi:hypothetical protein